jgi:acyl dehydratase
VDGAISGLSGTFPARWFDDFVLGERFVLPSRTITENILRAFAEASGEPETLYRESDNRALAYNGVVALAFLVTIQALPRRSAFPFLVEDSLVRMLDQSSRYVRSVDVGDTLNPVLQVTELEPGTGSGVVSLRATVHNQRRELVVEGCQRWLIRNRPQT